MRCKNEEIEQTVIGKSSDIKYGGYTITGNLPLEPPDGPYFLVTYNHENGDGTWTCETYDNQVTAESRGEELSHHYEYVRVLVGRALAMYTPSGLPDKSENARTTPTPELPKARTPPDQT